MILSLTRFVQWFRREVLIWTLLNHPNILPFLGTADVSDLPRSLVSPWMQNGNSIDYLKLHDKIPPLRIVSVGSAAPNYGQTNSTVQCEGIARALTFLHSRDPPVIHGDLRGVTIPKPVIII